MHHKKEWFSVGAGVVMDVAHNPHVISIVHAVLCGSAAWVGARLIELLWNWIVRKMKGNE